MLVALLGSCAIVLPRLTPTPVTSIDNGDVVLYALSGNCNVVLIGLGCACADPDPVTKDNAEFSVPPILNPDVGTMPEVPYPTVDPVAGPPSIEPTDMPPPPNPGIRAGLTPVAPPTKAVPTGTMALVAVVSKLLPIDVGR